jgi:putative ABC transport system permease protein
MLKNYFKSAFRQFTRNRLFSVLNILGLATGLCGSIFIFLWVQDELSFDRWNRQPDTIFRLTVTIGDTHVATTSMAVAPALHRLLPAVQQATRFGAEHPRMVAYGEKRFIEKKVWYADSNFQQLFNFPLVKGDPGHVLRSNNEILITESAAKKYFGDKDPMGQRLRIEDKDDYVVAGVLKDIPANSHLQFDFLLSMSIQEERNRAYNPWDNFIYYSYLRLDRRTAGDPAAIAALNKQIDVIYHKNYPDLPAAFSLQRLTDIHLGQHYFVDVPGQGSLQYVRIFSLVALFILVIACINFMNLSTALSDRRAKEVGLRKTVGASKAQLIGQFLGEAVFLSLIAMAAAIFLAGLLLPLFNDLTGKTFDLSALAGGRLLLLLGITIGAGVVSGSYPALVLSRFQPVKVLKGNRGNRGLRTRTSVAKQLGRSSLFQPGRAYFRNGLVILQFTIAITLMVGTVVVYRQLHFIGSRDMGFDKSNLLYVSVPPSDRNSDMLKAARLIDAGLANRPGIAAHTIVDDLPTYLTSGQLGVQWAGKDPRTNPLFALFGADENFLNTFGTRLVAGRYFSKAYGNEDSNVVVNETAVRVMHMDPTSALGRTINMDGKLTIIGVVKDFNFKPVTFAVDPLIVLHNWSRGNEYVVVKTEPGSTEKAIGEMKKQFGAVYPAYPFTYGFVDQDLNRLYVSEQQMGRLFNVFSVLAIFISCLGLFGLSAYTTRRRIKEIGIRKVLGAGIPRIVTLLAREFLLPVVLATLIAFPLAGWIMDKWLHAFVYRISLEWWFFAFAGMLALLIALGTVGFQALQAARANPVRSLRSE